MAVNSFLFFLYVIHSSTARTSASRADENKDLAISSEQFGGRGRFFFAMYSQEFEQSDAATDSARGSGSRLF